MAERDPILDELHAIRERMLDEAGGDLDVLARRVNEQARKAGCKLERLPPRRVATSKKSKRKAS